MTIYCFPAVVPVSISRGSFQQYATAMTGPVSVDGAMTHVSLPHSSMTAYFTPPAL